MKFGRFDLLCILMASLAFFSGCDGESSSNTELRAGLPYGESPSYLGNKPIATNKNPVCLVTPALPFPSDLFARTDPSTQTGIRIELKNGLFNRDVHLIPRELQPEDVFSDADGYSSGTPILFELDGPVDPDTLPLDGGDAVGLFDYTTGARIPVNVRMSQVAAHTAHNVKGHVVQAIPRGRLSFGHRYIAYITGALKRADGGAFARSSGFKKAISGDSAETVSRFYTPHLDFLEERGIKRDVLLSATVFTVRSRDNAMKTMLDFARATYNRDFGVKIISYLRWPDPSSYIAAKVVGRVEIINYRDSDNAMDMDPQRNEGKKEWVDFILFIPGSARTGPVPVCMYGHGYGVFKETALPWAINNASVGVATIAIDLIGHGLRSFQDNWDASKIDEPDFGEAWKFCSMVMGAPLDHLALLKALQTSQVFKNLDIMGPDPCQGDGKPDLDASSIIYQGTSLGAMQGTTFSALAPGLKGSYVHVGGSNMSYIFNDGVLKDDFCETRPEGFTGADTALIFAVWQQVWEIFDNLDYLDSLRQGLIIPGRGGEAPMIITPHPHAMVYAIDDTSVPQLTSLTMAYVLGMPLLSPVLEDVDYLDHADDFIDGFGLLQVDPVKIDLSALDPVFQQDVTGGLTHILGGLHPQALTSQREWIRQVLFSE